jgi:hypothetical protein
MNANTVNEGHSSVTSTSVGWLFSSKYRCEYKLGLSPKNQDSGAQRWFGSPAVIISSVGRS